MIFNVGRPGDSKAPPKAEFTGKWSGIVPDGTGGWTAEFYSSGVLTFKRLGTAKTIDIFAVGGGGHGIEGESGGGLNPGHPGRGGNGGETKTVRMYQLKFRSLTVKIGKDVPIYPDESDLTLGTTSLRNNDAEVISALPAQRNETSGTAAFDEPGQKEYGKRGSYGTGGDAKIPGDGGNGGTAGWNSYGPGGSGKSGILIMRNARDAA